MTFIFKFVAVVLVAGVLALALPMVLPSQPMAVVHGGCHEGGTMPSPQPANYSCCQSGHNFAVLQVGHFQEFVLSEILSSTAPVAALSSFIPPRSGQDFSTYEPPGGSPLRI